MINTLTSLTDSLITAILPDDCSLSNEFRVSSVRQSTRTTIGGKLVFQQGQTYSGRSLVLVGTDEGAWITREDVINLQSMFDTVNDTYLLSFEGDTYSVIFDYAEASPIVAEPIIPCCDPPLDAWYTFELKLLTVDV